MISEIEDRHTLFPALSLFLSEDISDYSFIEVISDPRLLFASSLKTDDGPFTSGFSLLLKRGKKERRKEGSRSVTLLLSLSFAFPGASFSLSLSLSLSFFPSFYSIGQKDEFLFHHQTFRGKKIYPIQASIKDLPDYE